MKTIVTAIVLCGMLAGCATGTPTSTPAKQEQLILTVPAELLQPIDQLQPIVVKDKVAK